MGGMGGGKMNMSAMKSQMNKNLKQAKMKEECKKNYWKQKQQENMTTMQENSKLSFDENWCNCI